LWSGLCFALLLLIRPIAILLPLVLFSYLIWNERKIILLYISFILICYSMTFLWIQRNYLVFEKPFVTSISSVNLYFHASAGVLAEANKQPYNQVQKQLKNKLIAAHTWKGDESDIAPMIHFLNQESIQIFKNHPLVFIKQSLMSIGYFFLKPLRGYIDNFFSGNNEKYNAISERGNLSVGEISKKVISSTSKTTLILVVFQLIVSAILMIGILFSFLNQNKFLVIFLIMLIYFSIFSSVSEVDARFRIPVMPYISILAIMGLNEIYKRFFFTGHTKMNNDSFYLK
jgi:hypothetical protein